MEETRIIHGNALDLPLEDSSVDLVVTSPPYFALRSYRDGDEHYDGQVGSEATPQEFLEALWAATREMVRVLKPSGSIFVNLGDKYAGSGGHNNWGSLESQFGTPRPSRVKRSAEQNSGPLATRRNAPDRYNQNSGGIPAKSLMGLPWRYAIGCADQLGLILRAEIVWNKPNGLPESVTDRVRRSHEQWFHFTKQPRYFSAVDEIREPSQIVFTAPQNGTQRHAHALAEGEGDHRYDVRTNNPLGKLPGSVWTIREEDVDWIGKIGLCRRCGKLKIAGSGSVGVIPADTASTTCQAEASSGSTESPSNSGEVQSPRERPSTTSAETEDASTPTTSRPSAAGSTSSEAATPSKPIVPQDTPTTTPTQLSMTAAAFAVLANGGECDCVTGPTSSTGHVSSVWTVPSEPLIIPPTLGLPDHFAAFPQEFPRRLILGWSPSGICVECGEGRRPVVDASYLSSDDNGLGRSSDESGRHRLTNRWGDGQVATIVGYACACIEPTADTIPAVVLDPFCGTGTVPMVARALGRVGIGVDLSADYCKLAEWRVFHSGHADKTERRTWAERQLELL